MHFSGRKKHLCLTLTDISEKMHKNTNNRKVTCVFKNTLKLRADKNKETKAAPKLRQDESITHAKIQSGWKMAQLQS